jgi:O-antigen/teichoic acid export membrane protein
MPGTISSPLSPFTGSRFRAALRHFLLGRALQGVAALAFTLLAVRLMPRADYGAYLVILGLIEVLRPLSSLGLAPTVQQFLPEMALHAPLAQLHRFMRWAQGLRWLSLVAVIVPLFLLWPWAAPAFGLDGTGRQQALLPCALILFVLAAEFCEQMLESLLEQKFAQAVRLAYTVLRLCGLLALAAWGDTHLDAVLAVDVVASLLCLLAAEGLLRTRLARLRPDGSVHFHRQDVVRFGLHLTASQALNALTTAGALRLVVARVLGLEAAGLFGFLQTLLGQVNRLLPSLLLVNLVRPMLIAARVKGETGRVAQACGLLYKSNVLLVWPLVPLAALGGDRLTDWLSGGTFEHGGVALAGLTLALVGMTQTQVNAIVLQVFRRSELLLRIGALAALAPLLVAAGAWWSLNAAVLGFVVAVAVRSAYSTWVIQRSSARMDIDLRGTLRFAAALALAAGLALAAAQFGSALIGAAVFIGLLLPLALLARPLSAQDLALLQHISKRRLGFLQVFVSAAP